MRYQPPKVDRVIGHPQGPIYVSLKILGLKVFLENCPQDDTNADAADAADSDSRQTYVSPGGGET